MSSSSGISFLAHATTAITTISTLPCSPSRPRPRPHHTMSSVLLHEYCRSRHVLLLLLLLLVALLILLLLILLLILQPHHAGTIDVSPPLHVF